MHRLIVRFELMSAATFGRGDGVSGLVDREVEHDAYGMPYLRGRTLKGLLAEECANILFALERPGKAGSWGTVAERLFGQPGSTAADRGLLRVGDACLPQLLRDAVKAGVLHPDHRLTPTDVLESLTAIRRQTSLNELGAPAYKSLRSMRVVLPGTVFEAALEFEREPTPAELELLAACVLAWRRAGTARNRGRGRLKADLYDAAGREVTVEYYRSFAQEVGE